VGEPSLTNCPIFGDQLTPLLPDKVGDAGRTAADNRQFVNGYLWVLRAGAHWRDQPERYGKWKTVRRRFSRWCQAGVWDRVFASLTTTATTSI